ncbi:MAG: PAS domain-containing protein, partial [Sulfurimonadaceae bacterium]|nr:PAS domain-containing protein [Sulfurimonadaceae bacterium]
GRTWMVETVAKESYIKSHYPQEPFYILIGGVFTSIIVLLIHLIFNYKQEQLTDENRRRKEGEQKLQELLDNAPVGIVVIREGIYTYANTAAVKIGKCRKEDLLGQSHMAFVHEEDRERDLAAYEALMDGSKRVVSNDIRIVTPDDETVWISYSAIRNDSSDTPFVYVTFYDITERIKATDQVKLERDLAQSYLDIASVMVIALDLDGNIALINQTGCQMLGCSEPGALIGQSWFEHFIQESERDTTFAYFRKMLQRGSEISVRHENFIVTKSGEKRLISWQNALTYDEKGNVTGTLSSGMDITEARTYQQQLEARIEELNRFQKLAVGRELRVNELRKRLEKYETPKGEEADDD